MIKPKPSEPPVPTAEPLPGTNHTWFGLLVHGFHRRRTEAIKSSMSEMYTGILHTATFLDLQKCLHIVKSFSGLGPQRLADRCGISLTAFLAMQAKNRCKSVDILEALEKIARQYYLEEVEDWFGKEKRRIQYSQRPKKSNWEDTRN